MKAEDDTMTTDLFGEDPRPEPPAGGKVQARVAADLKRAAVLGAQPAPVPQPLPAALLPVVPFPVAALPLAFRPWVEDVAERMQVPADFVAVPMLVGAASLVARQVAVRPRRLDEWTERGNLWAVLVGRPGMLKSPAMEQALSPLNRLEARAADAFNEEAKAHRGKELTAKLKREASASEAKKRLKKSPDADVSALLTEDDEDDAPVRPRYIVNDLTYEKLGELLAENPRGVLCVRDELRGLLAHLAKEDQAPARAFYLTAWSGGRYTFDRIGRGTVTIDDARLSVIGSIQPGPLMDLVAQVRRGAADDGMLDRFLIAWPDAPTSWRQVDRLPDSEAKRRAWEVFERLDVLQADELHAEQGTAPDGTPRGLPFLRLDEDAREAFSEWERDLQTRLRGGALDGLESPLSKFAHHVPALALALHVIDGETGAVTADAMVRALALAEYFESHARRLYSSGRSLAVRAARAILDRVTRGDLSEQFTAREVHRPRWAGLSDHATVSEGLDMLTAHGWLTETTADTGGRPTTLYSLTEGARRGQVA